MVDVDETHYQYRLRVVLRGANRTRGRKIHGTHSGDLAGVNSILPLVLVPPSSRLLRVISDSAKAGITDLQARSFHFIETTTIRLARMPKMSRSRRIAAVCRAIRQFYVALSNFSFALS